MSAKLSESEQADAVDGIIEGADALNHLLSASDTFHRFLQGYEAVIPTTEAGTDAREILSVIANAIRGVCEHIDLALTDGEAVIGALANSIGSQDHGQRTAVQRTTEQEHEYA